MNETTIRFTKRITNSHTPVESRDIPVGKLADETVNSYDHRPYQRNNILYGDLILPATITCTTPTSTSTRSSGRARKLTAAPNTARIRI